MSEISEVKNEFFVYKLVDFEGPLDLLLHLVKEAKIEIKHIFMSDITEQFLTYMEQLSTIDMEKASEFVDVASTLLEIKVKSLLPKLDDFISEEEEDPKERLIKQLEEYNLFKEAGEKLKEQENVSRFYKQPDEKPRKIVKDRFTVAEKIEHIKQILSDKKTMSFFELFEIDFTKSEMINTFLALLELLKLHFLSCMQNTLFGDIILTYIGEDNGN